MTTGGLVLTWHQAIFLKRTEIKPRFPDAHAALSSSFPPIYLTMWGATHMPCRLFLFLPILFDDAA